MFSINSIGLLGAIFPERIFVIELASTKIECDNLDIFIFKLDISVLKLFLSCEKSIGISFKAVESVFKILSLEMSIPFSAAIFTSPFYDNGL